MDKLLCEMLPVVIARCLWRERNLSIFENKEDSVGSLINTAQLLILNWVLDTSIMTDTSIECLIFE